MPALPSSARPRPALLRGGARRAGALAATCALAAPLAAATVLGLPTAALAAETDIKISEVQSDGLDWVELTNVGSEPVDISGWYLKDDDDGRDWTVPAGTEIAPGEHVVIEHEDAGTGGFDFGLGNGDQVRLFLADGTTLIDGITYESHPLTSWIVVDGEVVLSAEETKGAPNSGVYVPPPPAEEHADADALRISEVSSDNPSGDDWVEILNVSDRPVELDGWYLLDEKDTETPAEFPAGPLQPGERAVLAGDAGLGFGLGKGDSARLFAPNGYLVDSVTWTDGEHATPSWQRAEFPDGEFAPSHVATQGAANIIGPVIINETNSQGDDFVELKNLGSETVDLSGYRILDSEDDHVFTFPEGTEIGAGELLLVTGGDEGDLGYGLGGTDMVRLYDASGLLLGQVAWQGHVNPSHAFCGDVHTGTYGESGSATPGQENDCSVVEAPTGIEVPTTGPSTVADEADEFGEDLSGLDLEILADGTQVLWGVNNDAGQISRLVQDADGTWVQSDGWPTGGQSTRFADGTGTPDGEGISVGLDGRIYVAAERDNSAGGTSRNTVLAFDATSGESELVAESEWNLTSLLPATGANSGLEGIEVVPAAAFSNLVAEVPAAAVYAFVVLEATGDVYAVALHEGGEATLVATLPSPLGGLMALDYDLATNTLWAFADDAHDGQSVRYRLSEETVAASEVHAAPTGLQAVANEGVALVPTEVCTDGVRQAWFSDDNDTDGHALRGIELLVEDCTGGAGSEDDGDEDGTGNGDGAGNEDGTGNDGAPSDGGGDDAGSGDAAGGAGSAGGAAEGSAPGSSGDLARTGTEAAGLIAAAMAAIAGGVWLVRRSREG
jgi:hypothetical protein